MGRFYWCGFCCCVGGWFGWCGDRDFMGVIGVGGFEFVQEVEVIGCGVWVVFDDDLIL